MRAKNRFANPAPSPRPGVGSRVYGILFGLLLAIGTHCGPVVESRAADTIEPSASGIVAAREIATRDLSHAHERAERTATAAHASRHELDEFLVQHFGKHRAEAEAPLPPLVEDPKKIAADPEFDRLNGQLQDLTNLRDQLLDRFTSAHPEVASVERRIAEINRRLASHAPRSPSKGLTSPPPLAANWIEQLSAVRQHDRESAQEYLRLSERFRSAEQERLSAVKAELAAHERLAALPLSAAETVASAPMIIRTETQNSQPLALAALLIALAVAALAAVRLARSSTDAAFATVDEIGAAMALPIVAVFPAVQSSVGPASSPKRRRSRMFSEIVLALIVFAAVASVVRNPQAVSQFVTHPADGISRLTQSFVR